MKRKIAKYLMYILFFIGILGAASLVISELQQGSICPKIMGIPACYIILACFIGLLAIHLYKLPNKYFYTLAAFPIAIALYGTIFQIFGGVECPKTDGGIPMCFISLGLFSGITACKYLISRK